ncbi:hypothetical protein PCASD_05025 [Puccinia coronata f. sp. avenae]|uniref:Uncharacterized protein n=1 Tax=Puccinia coronata f. sp. avenae TaxID=200324 RepID=A0A2N5UNK6_9BASI|nr:hypothetical protein PCASD_05025 [Puccinia coronata f. sp. avenae]
MAIPMEPEKKARSSQKVWLRQLPCHGSIADGTTGQAQRPNTQVRRLGSPQRFDPAKDVAKVPKLNPTLNGGGRLYIGAPREAGLLPLPEVRVKRRSPGTPGPLALQERGCKPVLLCYTGKSLECTVHVDPQIRDQPTAILGPNLPPTENIHHSTRQGDGCVSWSDFQEKNSPGTGSWRPALLLPKWLQEFSSRFQETARNLGRKAFVPDPRE